MKEKPRPTLLLQAAAAAAAAILLTASPLIAQQATSTVAGEVRLRTDAARPVTAEAWEHDTPRGSIQAAVPF